MADHDNEIYECKSYVPDENGVLKVKKVLSRKRLRNRFWELRKLDSRSYREISEDRRNGRSNQSARNQIHYGDGGVGGYLDEPY